MPKQTTRPKRSELAQGMLDAHHREVREAVAAERERCAKMVPTNWLDLLLTGPDAPKHPLDNRGVEKLLRGIQNRIRNQEE